MCCGFDGTGRAGGKIASESEALIGWFHQLGTGLTRIGLEAGPLSQWVYSGMRDAGSAVELLDPRHVRDAFKAMPVKTDRKDARGIAQVMRRGWFRSVHCKSLPAQETLHAISSASSEVAVWIGIVVIGWDTDTCITGHGQCPPLFGTVGRESSVGRP